jgi:ATP-dependent DNA ligase
LDGLTLLRLDTAQVKAYSTINIGHERTPRRLRAEQPQPRFEPCLPRAAEQPPAGSGWLHEIKHDGFRILAHRQGRAIRLMT